eukprot:TRINITY_DN13519_c0_g1_i1.p1 TRINITY_DN13519_c0_g1~~TRINITY_DN13519_c0_g1_i1.p1  ORF type:complete len:227 (+),score=56.94 TRINITY_DN13519_c0_g1_i1:50-730(+)
MCIRDRAEEVCAQLRTAMDEAMIGSSHRGGYCLLYPDTPQAREAMGEQSCELFSRVKREMREACQRQFGVTERLWVGGTLLSRIEHPAPGDGKDTNPSHDYSGLHVDQYNRHFYEYSALLYLAESGEDFQAGEFEFVDDPRLQEADSQEALEELASSIYDSPCSADIPQEFRTAVLPKIGRLLMFRAGLENPHFVARVKQGCRHLFSVWLTSNPLYGHQDLSLIHI